jgi:hypothetical protein
MKYIYLLLFFAVACTVNAQTINRDSLVGEWSFIEVKPYPESELKPKEKPLMDTFLKIFTDARFIFKSESIFFCEFPKAPAQVRAGLESVNGKKWTYQPEHNRIIIDELHENLMHLYVHNINGAMVFEMADVPLFLTAVMKK